MLSSSLFCFLPVTVTVSAADFWLFFSASVALASFLLSLSPFCFWPVTVVVVAADFFLSLSASIPSTSLSMSIVLHKSLTNSSISSARSTPSSGSSNLGTFSYRHQYVYNMCRMAMHATFSHPSRPSRVDAAAKNDVCKICSSSSTLVHFSGSNGFGTT